jgi:hypothetical protein
MLSLNLAEKTILIVINCNFKKKRAGAGGERCREDGVGGMGTALRSGPK